VILSDGYRNRIFELSGIILENRIEKLQREKYPEDIINFALEFAKLTTKDASVEDNVLRNHYIPWIAQEARKNPGIVNEKDKLDVIILWIKNANYPKISTNEGFDVVFNKAKDWLSKRNIDPSSGERIEGGRVIKTYPNGFRWVRVTNTNWCMNVGKKYGWCFSSPERSESFVGLDSVDSTTQGYILLNAKDKPALAVQYDSSEDKIEDIQATFNKPATPAVLKYGLDLFGSLGKITDITSHQDNFWKTLKENPELKDELMAVPTVSFSTKLKLDKKLPITPAERSSLDLEALLKYGVPLTQEEIVSVPIRLKLQYNISLSNQEIKLLKTSKDLFIAKLWRATRSRAYEKIFTDEDFSGYNGYHFDYDKRAVKIDMDETEFEEKFSGLEEDNRTIYNMVNSYGYSEEVDRSETDYMYNSLNAEQQELIKKVGTQLGMGDYDFEKEGELAKFLEDYTDVRIEDDFLAELSYGWERNAVKAVNEVVDSEQKFRYENGYLVLPFKALYEFVAAHPEKNIQSFNDLKEAEINGTISVESAYSDSRTGDDESYENFNKIFKEKITEFMDKVASGEIEIARGIQRAHNILNSLGFKKMESPSFHGHYFHGNVYGVRNQGRVVFVEKFDFEDQTFSVRIFDFGNVKTIRKNAKPKKELKGKIPFDRLSDYVYQYELFESMKLRKAIRIMLAEDFRYLYDRNPFVPPVEVAKAASEAINAVTNNRVSGNSGGNEGSGTQKARSLANREPMNHAQLKRMKAFFDKNEEAVKNELSHGRNMSNSGIIQSWNLWGGDAGRQWANRQISSVQSSNKTSKKIRNPEDGVRTKTLMDPHNTRIHRGGSVAKVSESTETTSKDTFGTVGDKVYYDGKHIANVVYDAGHKLFYIHYKNNKFRSGHWEGVLKKFKNHLGLSQEWFSKG
jgi:hypothetical protein